MHDRLRARGSRSRGREGGPPLSVSTAYLLSLLGRSQAAGLAERLAPLGLRPRHFALLNVVALDEGRSQQELGERLALEPSGVVRTIDELEEQGLLQRQRDSTDRRRYAVHLTPTGRETLSDARRAAAERASALFGPLED